MTLNALQTLSALHRYLQNSVAPMLPDNMSGEFRALLKSMKDIALETQTLHGALSDERAQLVAVSVEAIDHLQITGLPMTEGTPLETLRRRAEVLSQPNVLPSNMTDLARHHEDAKCLAWSLLQLLQSLPIPRLSAHDQGCRDQLLARFYRTLKEHAQTRIPWQSVFTVGGSPPTSVGSAAAIATPPRLSSC